MAVKTIAELKAKFETGDQPQASDFVDLIDSFLHAGLANFPAVLPAVSAANLTNIPLPDPLPALDGSALININPSEWTALPDVPSYATATSFVLFGDLTTRFKQTQRLRLTIDGAYFYTEVTTRSYDGGLNATTVNIADDMPSNLLTAVAVSAITPMADGGSVSPTMIGLYKGEDIAAAATLDVGTTGNLFLVTGADGITAISPRPAGQEITLIFADAPTLTHSANLISPFGADITTNASMMLTFRSEGGGVWRCQGAAPLFDDTGRMKAGTVPRQRLESMGAYAFASAAQSLPHATTTAITFNMEGYDTHGFFDSAVNNTRFTIPAGLGISHVRLHGSVSFSANATSGRRIMMRKNGAGGTYGDTRVQAMNSGLLSTVISTSTPPIPVVDGDYLELFGEQHSGGALDVFSSLWLEVVD